MKRLMTLPGFTNMLLCIILLCIGQFEVIAQDEDIFGIDRKLRGNTRKSESGLGNVVRNAIGGISFEASAGSGVHFNSLNFHSQSPAAYGNITSVLTAAPSEVEMGDTLSFRGAQMAHFAQVGVKLNLLGLLVVGGGYGREVGRIDPLKIEDYRFGFENNSYTFDRLYGTAAIVLFDAKKRANFLNLKYKKYDENNYYMQTEKRLRMQQEYLWRFMLDAEFGRLISRSNFDSRIRHDEPYYGIGFRVERDLSEYTHVFIRPAVTFRTFAYNREDLMEMQELDQTVATIQIGASLRLPATKKCKIPGCAVVMKHLHNGVEYRGSSIWKRQHRKVGQWYGN
jgi:hypothetical protein